MYCSKCGLELPKSSKFCSKCGEKQYEENGPEERQHIHEVMDPRLHSEKTNEINHSTSFVSKKNKKIGTLWLVLPASFLILLLILYSISSYVTSNIDSGSSSVIMNIINATLGFLGTISVLFIIIGIIIGIIYLNKQTPEINSKFDERSGKGSDSDFPEELAGWNWGAASLTWIWGAFNGVWISLLTFIPILNWLWWIILGIKGNKWAWENNKWESVAEFKKIQRNWNTWGIIIFILNIVCIIGLLSTLSIVALNTARGRSRDARRVADIKQIQIAIEMYYNDASFYPDSLDFEGAIVYNGETYMSEVPTNPKPNDGDCPSDFEYKYNVSPDKKSYELTYCLGAEVATLNSGISIATPSGLQQKKDNSIADENSAINSEEFLKQVVQEMKNNLTLPEKVDDTTTITDITAEPSAIRYHYALNNIDPSKISVDILKQYLTDGICSTDELKSLLNENINLEYLYLDTATQKSYLVSFSKDDCLLK